MLNQTNPLPLLRSILECIEARRPFAVVTLIDAAGSTPACAGSVAVVMEDGSALGTVGGGAVEGEARRRATDAIRDRRAVLLPFDLHGPGMAEAQPVCGGIGRILIDPTASSAEAAYAEAVRALEQRRRGVWVSTLTTDAALRVESRYLSEATVVAGETGPDAPVLRACLARESPALVLEPASGDRIERGLFASPLLPPPVLLIVGGGHVGQAVAAQASLVGFDITVLDDRPEYARPERFPPGVVSRCADLAGETARFPLDRDTFVVIVTRGHQHDAAVLAACIRRPTAYVGLIGSRRKIPLMRRDFMERGWATAEEFDRVYAPIGLELGAVTVPEIAASIVAQLIAVRRRGAAPRWSPGDPTAP